MPYQYKREPLLPEEATHLAQVCQTVREKLLIWTLLDTWLRVSVLASLTPAQIDWQDQWLTIYGRNSSSPLSPRVLPARWPHLTPAHSSKRDQQARVQPLTRGPC
jgi:integrase